VWYPFNTAQPVVHLIDEPLPAQLAIGQDIDTGIDLIGNDHAGRIFKGFFDVVRSGAPVADGFAKWEHPAWRCVTADPHCGQRGQVRG